jgi:hypothetical protein
MKNVYIVVQQFGATAAISGRERQFLPGEILFCDPALSGETVIIEVDEFLFLTDRSTFKACCQWKNEGFVS